MFKITKEHFRYVVITFGFIVCAIASFAWVLAMLFTILTSLYYVGIIKHNNNTSQCIEKEVLQ
jgi:hypothetical protein